MGVDDLMDFIKIFAPYAPFLAEELWSRINYKEKNTNNKGANLSPHQTLRSREDSVHLQSWPVFDPSAITEKTVTMVVQINGKLRDSFQLPQETSQVQDEVEKIVYLREKILAHIAGKKVKKIIFVPGRLINLVVG